MRLHPDTKFTIASVTAFALVAVLLPMSMLMTGCHMMAIDFATPMSSGPTISSVCDMVQDPALPDSASGPGMSLLMLMITAMLAAVFALVLPRHDVTRTVVPVAAAPPPKPPELPLGQRLRL